MQLGLSLAGKGEGLETHGRIKLDIAFAHPDCIAFNRFHFNSAHAVLATSGTCPFPMALSLSTLAATP